MRQVYQAIVQVDHLRELQRTGMSVETHSLPPELPDQRSMNASGVIGAVPNPVEHRVHGLGRRRSDNRQSLPPPRCSACSQRRRFSAIAKLQLQPAAVACRHKLTGMYATLVHGAAHRRPSQKSVERPDRRREKNRLLELGAASRELRRRPQHLTQATRVQSRRAFDLTRGHSDHRPSVSVAHNQTRPAARAQSTIRRSATVALDRRARGKRRVHRLGDKHYAWTSIRNSSRMHDSFRAGELMTLDTTGRAPAQRSSKQRSFSSNSASQPSLTISRVIRSRWLVVPRKRSRTGEHLVMRMVSSIESPRLFSGKAVRDTQATDVERAMAGHHYQRVAPQSRSGWNPSRAKATSHRFTYEEFGVVEGGCNAARVASSASLQPRNGRQRCAGGPVQSCAGDCPWPLDRHFLAVRRTPMRPACRFRRL